MAMMATIILRLCSSGRGPKIMTFLYREPVHAPLSIYAGWEDMGGVVVMKKLVMVLSG